MTDRTFRIISLALAGLVALLLIAAVASAAGATVDPETNRVAYWCGSEDDGIKYEPVDTPFIVPEPPEGKTWTKLVLKGGTTNEVIPHPVVGQGYSHSVSANSHVILCWENEEVTTTTSSTTTTTSTTSTTTTVPTTTTAPSTTTTVPVTTTSSSTTTTDPTTTTTNSPTTTLGSTTTVPVTSTVPPTTTTTPPELPKTGTDLGWLALIGMGLLLLGGATLVGQLRKQN